MKKRYITVSGEKGSVRLTVFSDTVIDLAVHSKTPRPGFEKCTCDIYKTCYAIQPSYSFVEERLLPLGYLQNVFETLEDILKKYTE